MLDDNPLLMRLYVGETPIFNWILLIWFVPSLLALWLASLVKPLNAKLSQITLGVSGLLPENTPDILGGIIRAHPRYDGPDGHQCARYHL